MALYEKTSRSYHEIIAETPRIPIPREQKITAIAGSKDYIAYLNSSYLV
jgi:hypothetical protein